MAVVANPAGETGWPPDEGVLGVVGVAPWATLDFLSALYRRASATKDWHYPRVLIDINTKLPSRGRHLQLGETDPSPHISETIDELVAAGATCVVVAFNTAHILFERWGTGHDCRVLNIIEATCDSLERAGPVHRVAVLASPSLLASDLYGRALVARGFEVVEVDESGGGVVAAAIESVKAGGALGHHQQQSLRGLLVELKTRGAESVVIGCTELSSVAQIASSLGLISVDSNLCLADAAMAAVEGRGAGR